MADNLGFYPHLGEAIATFADGLTHTIAAAGPHPIEETLYASASRTATPTATSVTTRGRQRCHVVIDVTAASSTPSVVPSIEAYDTLSATWYPLLTGTAITTTGTTVLKVGPGMSPVTGACAADMLPGTIRLSMTHADADPITYTASIHLAG
jgi:hypothetical protein